MPRAPLVPESVRDDLVRRYQAGASVASLARETGRAKGNMWRALHRWLAGPTKPRAEEVPDDLRAEVIRRYESGDTAEEISRDIGRTQVTVAANLRRWGVKTRRGGPRRTYTLDETYFSTIDTEEKAYWLGFLLADGNVHRSKQGHAILQIALVGSDVDQLRKLASALQTNGPVSRFTTARGYDRARFSVSSPRLVSDLEALGCVQRKTATHGTPNIRVDLLRHMYRGFTDGDGHLGYSAGYDCWHYEVVGSTEFVLCFQRWLIVAAGVRLTKPTPRGCVLSVHYCGGPQIARIAHALYGGATVYLDRKFELYQRLKERYPQQCQ